MFFQVSKKKKLILLQISMISFLIMIFSKIKVLKIKLS